MDRHAADYDRFHGPDAFELPERLRLSKAQRDMLVRLALAEGHWEMQPMGPKAGNWVRTAGALESMGLARVEFLSGLGTLRRCHLTPLGLGEANDMIADTPLDDFTKAEGEPSSEVPLRKFLVTCRVEYYSHVEAHSEDEAVQVARSANAWHPTLNSPASDFLAQPVAEETLQQAVARKQQAERDELARRHAEERAELDDDCVHPGLPPSGSGELPPYDHAMSPRNPPSGAVERIDGVEQRADDAECV